MMNEFDLQDCLTAMHMYATQAATPSSGRGPGDWTFWTCKAEIAGKLADEIERLDADAACERAEKESLKLEVARLTRELAKETQSRQHAAHVPQNEVEPTVIKNPLLVIFEVDTGIQCAIHAAPGYTHESYGLIVCDLVRHVALAFKVPEEAVWEWVDKERYHHTTDIRRPSRQRLLKRIWKAEKKHRAFIANEYNAVLIERDKLRAEVDQRIDALATAQEKLERLTAAHREDQEVYDRYALVVQERDRLQGALERIAKGDGWYPMHPGVQASPAPPSPALPSRRNSREP